MFRGVSSIDYFSIKIFVGIWTKAFLIVWDSDQGFSNSLDSDQGFSNSLDSDRGFSNSLDSAQGSSNSLDLAQGFSNNWIQPKGFLFILYWSFWTGHF